MAHVDITYGGEGRDGAHAHSNFSIHDEFSESELQTIRLQSRNITKGPPTCLRLQAASEYRRMKIKAGIIPDPDAPAKPPPPEHADTASPPGATAGPVPPPVDTALAIDADAPKVLVAPSETSAAARAAAAADAHDPTKTQKSGGPVGLSALYNSAIARRLAAGSNDPLQVEVQWSRLQYTAGATAAQAFEPIPVLCDKADTIAQLKDTIMLRQRMLQVAALRVDRMLLFVRSIAGSQIHRFAGCVLEDHQTVGHYGILRRNLANNYAKRANPRPELAAILVLVDASQLNATQKERIAAAKDDVQIDGDGVECWRNVM